MQSAGSLRLFDGLFVGDQHTARDEEFMLLNHITLVVNLTNTQIRNYYQHYQIRYINVNWKENKQQPHSFEGLCMKIGQNLEREESVLIHGLSNLDEPVSLSAIYIMNRFRWSLYKTLQYLQVRVAQLTFSSVSFNLLKMCELRLLNSETRLSYNWQIRPENQKQLVLRNTYLNSGQKQKNNKYSVSPSKKNKDAARRVTWNIKNISNSSRGQSHRVLTQRSEEDNRRNKIVLSVRKIIAQSINKQNRRSQDMNRGLKRSTQKLRFNKVVKQDQPSIPMKKYKSFYSLASLPSFENIQNRMTENSQKVFQNKLSQNLQKSQSQLSLKDRIKTEKSERYPESQNKFTGKIITLIKTENTQNNTSNGDTILSSTNSQIFSRKSSLVFKKDKQNTPPLAKISLRKPTPRKYQITLHK